MKTKEVVQNILWIILLIIILIGCSAANFILTSLVYAKIGLHPSAFWIQMINTFLSLMLMILFIKVIERFNQDRTGLFDPFINAQNRIAQGDFDVSIDLNAEGYGPFVELAESVNNMASELNRMEKMQQEFISNVSHEIQSPLTSIRGFSQALRDDKLSYGDKSHYLDVIEAESMRLAKLTDNLLRLASLETDTIRFEPKTYRLDKQIRKIILACEPQWSDKNINMDVSLEEVEITADEDILSQVWLNLINNSIKFTPEGGNVRMDLHRQGGLMVFTISDTGIGIAEKDLSHIFERFYKADMSRRPSIKGSGLGLSIVKKIIDMCDGTINVQSRLGEGTTFTVSLLRSL